MAYGKKSGAQLDREIAEALSKKRSGTRPGAPRSKRHHSTVKVKGRKLGSIGDVNPIDYGGGYIFSAPDVGGPWVEYFEGLDSDERASRLSYEDDADEKIDALPIQLYRVDLGKDAKDFLSDYDWVDWEKIADSVGQAASAYDPGKLRKAQDRARAVQDVAGYHGWHEFDQYPLQLTVSELKKRWGK